MIKIDLADPVACSDLTAKLATNLMGWRRFTGAGLMLTGEFIGGEHGGLSVCLESTAALVPWNPLVNDLDALAVFNVLVQKTPVLFQQEAGGLAIGARPVCAPGSQFDWLIAPNFREAVCQVAGNFAEFI